MGFAQSPDSKPHWKTKTKWLFSDGRVTARASERTETRRW